MRFQDIEFKDQRAPTLICDLLHLLEVAATASIVAIQGASARAAVVNAVLLLECAANSGLLSLALPSRLAEEIDKLPTLAKLDYFLFAMAAKHIDRGCREAELAAEVLRLRDHIVHPKPRAGVLVADDCDSPYVYYGRTNALSIPFDTRDWSASIALSVAQAAVAFAKRFFLEWCALDKGRVTTILMVREKELIVTGHQSFVTVSPDVLSLANKFLPEILDFIDFREREPDAQPL